MGGQKLLHEEMLRRSVQIKGKGPPTFQLPFQPIEGTDRYQLGVGQHDALCMTVLLLGLIGSGKSMLLEVLGNYGLGVEFGDPYRFQVKEEEGPTDKIASYTFFTRDIQRFPCPITFIDTPGFQRGRPEDDRMLMNEIRAFIDRYHKQGIQAVIYVVPGSQARLTAEQKKVLGNMAEVLGDESASIPFLFCTFADSKRLPVLESVREAGLRYQKHFVVNSSSYFANEEDEDEPSTDDEEERMKAKTSSINELLWKVTTENIQEFIRILLTRLIGVVPPPPPPPSIFTRLCDWISRNIKSPWTLIAIGIGMIYLIYCFAPGLLSSPSAQKSDLARTGRMSES